MGTIQGFKEQITRFAACKFTIIGPGPQGEARHINAGPFERFDVWFPPDPKQETLWPSEIVLTDKYYYSLKDHAIPFDFRALKAIQNKPRAQDIYLWMTQRLCRIPRDKPLLMRWKDLHEMFGGQSTLKEFKRKFPVDLTAARIAYQDARIDEHEEGYLFRASLPPIPKRNFLFISLLEPEVIHAYLDTKSGNFTHIWTPVFLQTTAGSRFPVLSCSYTPVFNSL